MSEIRTIEKIKKYLDEIKKDLEILKRRKLSEYEKNYLKGIKALLKKIIEEFEF